MLKVFVRLTGNIASTVAYHKLPGHRRQQQHTTLTTYFPGLIPRNLRSDARLPQDPLVIVVASMYLLMVI